MTDKLTSGSGTETLNVGVPGLFMKKFYTEDTPPIFKGYGLGVGQRPPDIGVYYLGQLLAKEADLESLQIISGSNANGYYLIFPDNTAICWGKKSKDLTFSPVGNVCYSGFDWISFPITFSSIPNVNVSVQFGNIGSIQLGTIENYRFYSSVLSAESTPRPTTVHYSAFGEV